MALYLHTYLHESIYCVFFQLGGQKQSKRVSKLIQSCNLKLKKLLTQYLELGRDSGDARQHTIEEVCNLQSMFWISSDHTYLASADPTTVISPAIQRRLVELHRLEARIREEKQLLIAESIRRVDVYRTKLELFRSQSSLCAGDEAMIVINSQWLELQLYETELFFKSINAYIANSSMLM